MMPGDSAPLILANWEIRPADGSHPIYGDLRARKGPTPRTVVVICHGFKAFRKWGFFPALARAIALRGHAAVSFDFSRNGVGGEDSDLTDLAAFGENTHSRNVDEIRMVLDAITGGTLFPRRPERIGLIGHSRGGGEAILAANEDERVDTLVTWNAISAVGRWSPTDIEAWKRGETVYVDNKRTGQRLPMNPTFWEDLQANRDRLDIVHAGLRLRVPWLIVHGDHDETVPLANARALFEVAGDNAELLTIDGASHTFGTKHPYAGGTPELDTAIDATLNWFDQHLGGSPTASPPAPHPVL